ncbi:MAG: rod shape-determining protein RodA [Saprospiraceae bacterium]|nr:rod shape-determining protein RodA [Saprospiraceae bacterium]
MRERQGILSNADGIALLLWFLLSIGGVFAIYSATLLGQDIAFFDFGAKHGRQIIFWCASLLAIFVVLSMDYKLITSSAFLFYGFTLLLLALTLVIGAEIKGSKSWLRYGGFQIQPAELAKLGTALALAKYISLNENVFRIRKKILIVLAFIGVPMAFILLQGDFGSMMIYTILIFVLFREGFTPVPIYLGLSFIAIALLSLYFGFIKVAVGIVVLALAIFFMTKKKSRRNAWKPITFLGVGAILVAFMVNISFTKVLKTYQQDRVLILLGMKDDPKGAGYNLWQSKMAIGSGGFSGKGYKQGTQTQGDFVPEVSTDYIFASIGEEWGFIGSMVVLGLFIGLIVRLIALAERQRSTFSRIYIYCIACFFFMHAFVNIAMVIGLFPTVGIPLPFFSYGGSSLLTFSLMLAIVLRLDAERLYILR